MELGQFPVYDVVLLPKKEGFAHCSESSGYAFTVYDRETVEYKMGPLSNDRAKEVIAELTGWSAFNRGVGRPFGHEPSMKLYRHAVLITQYTGLDI